MFFNNYRSQLQVWIRLPPSTWCKHWRSWRKMNNVPSSLLSTNPLRMSSTCLINLYLLLVEGYLFQFIQIFCFDMLIVIMVVFTVITIYLFFLKKISLVYLMRFNDFFQLEEKQFFDSHILSFWTNLLLFSFF